MNRISASARKTQLRSQYFGFRKQDAIASSKVCLNIHYYDDCGFESPRIFDYLSRGAFVLTDRASSTRPFVVGQDLDDFSDKHELVKKLEYYLANEDARQRIAEQGFATASKYEYAQTCQVIANAIHELLSAREPLPKRLIHWGQARVRAHYMDLRDGMSLKRRNFLVLVE